MATATPTHLLASVPTHSTFFLDNMEPSVPLANIDFPFVH